MVLRHRGVRAGIFAAAIILTLTGTLVLAFELARARVPEHRAALERLVRAQTGLDVRFNELGLRWGWYGPEAVFRRVELGEPGRSNVLLRAPQLIVGFDAWRTMQTGQLAAGRITLVAPDIDLERLTRVERPADAGTSTRAARGNGTPARANLLDRWRGGRIELEGGTLRLPDPNGSSNPIIVQVRRASLRRSEDQWSGFGLVFLPERLGRAARLAVQVKGDPSRVHTLTGSMRFEGMRLTFAGWREALRSRPALARSLPALGTGDLTLNLALKNGRIEKANGQIKASAIAFGTPPWLDSAHVSVPHGRLDLDYLAADWRYVSRIPRGRGGQLQIEQLVLNRDATDAPLPAISIELGTGHVHGTVPRAPVGFTAAIAQWLAAPLVPAGVTLAGTAENLDFDWNTARPEGARLAASAQIDEGRVAASSGSFTLSGLNTHMTATESRVILELAAPAARLELERAAEPMSEMQLVSVLEISRSDAGWRLSTERLSVDSGGGELILAGALSGSEAGGAPLLDARGTISHRDIAELHSILANAARHAFGPGAMRLTAGRIEEGTFEMRGALDELFSEQLAGSGPASLGMPTPGGDSFRGSLRVRDARVAPDGAWPDLRVIDAKLSWDGARVTASIGEGRAGAFELDGVEAEWDASGARAAHISGRARAHVERALTWVRAHPEVLAHAPQLQDVDARGEALFDFDITVPPATVVSRGGSPPKTRSHVAAVLEGVQLSLAPDVPPIESLRGALAFDSGHLQRSTLTGQWQGSPLTLKVSERRDRALPDKPGTLAVQAQGVLDARKLAALSDVQDLADVSGEAAWKGELLYVPAFAGQPARWQGRVDSNLVGIASRLPAPFAKLASTSMPLHVEVSGSHDEADVRATLAEGVRSAFALKLRQEGTWQLERGTVHAGSGADAVDVVLQASTEGSGTDVRVQSQTLGLLTGTLVSAASATALRDVAWSRETLTGQGSVSCTVRFATCEAKFELRTDSVARALADLGFRADVAATEGLLSGQIEWQPRADHEWLENASGRVRLRLDDGYARAGVSTVGEPFPLLTVPALLSALARPAPEAVPSGDMHFTRLDADFDLRDGEAHTSNLHFDGDAEILMRGRTGLLARDYDYEAWVLRGEERIPASLRRLAPTPRVAAAWLALRELISGDSADRARVVLRLRGSWREPLVTVD
jgi:uncharacterized protein YhdP